LETKRRLRLRFAFSFARTFGLVAPFKTTGDRPLEQQRED
jgi:hypothetical protein